MTELEMHTKSWCEATAEASAHTARSVGGSRDYALAQAEHTHYVCRNAEVYLNTVGQLCDDQT